MLLAWQQLGGEPARLALFGRDLEALGNDLACFGMVVWIDATGCCAPFDEAFRCRHMTASDVQDAGYGVGEHGNSQGGGGCEYGREFVTPVGVESPACGGGPNETEVVEDFAVVDEVVSGLVLGWACHVESLLVKFTGVSVGFL